jgi:hypothetical protein
VAEACVAALTGRLSGGSEAYIDEISAADAMLHDGGGLGTTCGGCGTWSPVGLVDANDEVIIVSFMIGWTLAIGMGRRVGPEVVVAAEPTPPVAPTDGGWGPATVAVDTRSNIR